LLLQKMLAGPRARDTPLRDAVLETIRIVPTTSIPSFVASGLAKLEEDARSIAAEREETA